MPAKIEMGSITIHRIVEQEGPFFDALEFFPALTKELLEENRAWLQPRYIEPATSSCSASRATSCRRRITTS